MIDESKTPLLDCHRPLSNFVPRGFGFVHHSIAILYHQVLNPIITIRNFFLSLYPAARCWMLLRARWVAATQVDVGLG
jgi:hypothetical protein